MDIKCKVTLKSHRVLDCDYIKQQDGGFFVRLIEETCYHFIPVNEIAVIQFQEVYDPRKNVETHIRTDWQIETAFKFWAKDEHGGIYLDKDNIQALVDLVNKYYIKK